MYIESSMINKETSKTYIVLACHAICHSNNKGLRDKSKQYTRSGV